MGKRVFMFGAGASYADSGFDCPLDNSFLFHLAEKLKYEKPMFKKLEEFLAKLYDYDLWKKQGPKIGFEEIFTAVEMSLRWIEYLQEEHKTENYKPRDLSLYNDLLGNLYLPIFIQYHTKFKMNGNKFIKELKKQIEEIYYSLKYAMCKLSGKNLDSKGNLYSNFINKYVKNEGTDNNPSVIITTNYDLLLDNELIKNKLFNPKNGYFQIFWNDYKDYEKQKYEMGGWKTVHKKFKQYWNKEMSKIILLKLHGSINWKFDQKNNNNKNANDFTYERKINIGYKNSKRIAVAPLVIDKQLTFKPTSKFGRIWTKAFEELSKADEIIFIGYSFPPADFLAKDLFRKAYIARMKNKRSKSFKIFYSVSTKKADEKDIDKDAYRTRSILNDIYSFETHKEYLGDFKEALENLDKAQK